MTPRMCDSRSNPRACQRRKGLQEQAGWSEMSAAVAVVLGHAEWAVDGSMHVQDNGAAVRRRKGEGSKRVRHACMYI